MIALPHSIAALSKIKALINFGEGPRYTFWFSSLIAINYANIIFMLYMTLIKKFNYLELLIGGFIILTNFSTSTGGYILIIYIVIIPYLLNNKDYSDLIFYIFLIYVFPFDLIHLLNINYSHILSYIGGNLLIYNPVLSISLGSVARPLLNFSLMMTFSMRLEKKYPSNFFTKIKY